MDQFHGPMFAYYNPTGFFLLRLRKGPCISSKVGSVVGLDAHINNAAVSVTLQMLESTWHEVEYCLDILRAKSGTHIAVFWSQWVVLSSKTNQFCLIYFVFCVLEMWWINCGHSLFMFVCACVHGGYRFTQPFWIQ
jgi:hypothetical protein